MRLKSNSIYLVILLALFGLFNWQCFKSTRPGIPKAVRETISVSGINSPELMKAIVHYNAPADSNQLKALYWLLGNMDGNYTVQYTVEDSSGNQYHFPPSKYGSYAALENAWDSVEKKAGPLVFHADSFRMDQKRIKSAFLIHNIDQAFKAYQTFPWDKSYDFSTFCRWILPYRCANETVEPFREHFLKEYNSQVKNSGDTTVRGAAQLLNKLVNLKIGYKDSYNKETNVQTVEALEKSGYGNFYDINIYKVKVMRSFGIAASLDYTPFLADTSFGYAWTTVFLPDHSELRLEFPSGVKNLDKPGRLAKVYRRTFEKVRNSLFARKNIKESTPPFMGDYYYQDITDSLTSKTVKIHCPVKAGYAYLAVFNDGGWHPVSWGNAKDSVVIFHRMGTHIIYLPVKLDKRKLVPTGAPFVLDEKGIQHPLIPDRLATQNVFLSGINPDQKIDRGTIYTLYVWEGNWKRLFSFSGTDHGIRVRLPRNGLFLMKNKDLPHLERIFVVGSDGKQIFY
jgi:hypothetical protein